jgi:uncharacterized RDD family membrane protein YckC
MSWFVMMALVFQFTMMGLVLGNGTIYDGVKSACLLIPILGLLFFTFANFADWKQLSFTASTTRSEGELKTEPAYAGFRRRVTATVIDGVVLGIARGLLTSLFVPALLAVMAATHGWSGDGAVGPVLADLIGPSALCSVVNTFAGPCNFLAAVVFLFRSIMLSQTFGKISGGVLLVLLGLGSWLYYALMESSPLQGTIGKLVTGMKVTGLYGERISFLQATYRFLGKLISFGTFCLGYVYVAMSPSKQGFHDILSRCVVARK